MEYFHPEKALTLKLLLNWSPQPFQMGPEKIEIFNPLTKSPDFTLY